MCRSRCAKPFSSSSLHIWTWWYPLQASRKHLSQNPSKDSTFWFISVKGQWSFGHALFRLDQSIHIRHDPSCFFTITGVCYQCWANHLPQSSSSYQLCYFFLDCLASVACLPPSFSVLLGHFLAQYSGYAQLSRGPPRSYLTSGRKRHWRIFLGTQLISLKFLLIDRHRFVFLAMGDLCVWCGFPLGVPRCIFWWFEPTLRL